MNISYMLYQAERQPSVAEQRARNDQSGEMAAAVVGAGRAVRSAVGRVTGANRGKAPLVPGDDLIQAECLRR